MRSGNRLRILFLDYTNGIGLGGGQRSLQLLLEEIDRDRFELLLACPEGEELLSRIPHGITTYPLALPAGFRGLSRRGSGWWQVVAGMPGFFALRRSWARLVAETRPDIIHANNLKMLLVAALATPRSRAARLWHVRDILPRTAMTALLKRMGTGAATRVLAVSQAVAQELPASAEAEVVYNAVRLPDLTRIPAMRHNFRQRYALPDGECVIGYAGRLDSGKGLEILVEAFGRLAAGHPQVSLVIAGKGGLETSLRRQVMAAGCDKRVRFLGFVPDMGQVWSAIDIAVAPSTEPDSFPRTVVEAMAHGLPVAGAQIGGIGEAIVPGQTGCLVPAGDSDELRQALEGLVCEPELRRSQGAAGRLRCEELFSARRQARQMEAIYQEVARA
ncbi:MAG: glycosyltransferase family 4 protein [Bryobacterales bacterium]|nr:glycosyltransferase family 4 protein [Bryobacterales bacterium]